MEARLTFGEWLEDQLRARGLTQMEFARRIEVGQSTVSAWINGETRPRARAVRDVARALGIDEQQLLDRFGYPARRYGPAPEWPPPRDAAETGRGSPLDDPELTLWASYLGDLDPHDRLILEELARTMIRNKREDRTGGSGD